MAHGVAVDIAERVQSVHSNHSSSPESARHGGSSRRRSPGHDALRARSSRTISKLRVIAVRAISLVGEAASELRRSRGRRAQAPRRPSGSHEPDLPPPSSKAHLPESDSFLASASAASRIGPADSDGTSRKHCHDVARRFAAGGPSQLRSFYANGAGFRPGSSVRAPTSRLPLGAYRAAASTHHAALWPSRRRRSRGR